MIHYLTGKLALKKENCFILEIGGVGIKVSSSLNSLKNMPAIGETIKIFTHLHIREDAWDIYGFFNQSELDFFVKLISVNGVGPKTALGILNVDTTEKLKAAINEGKVDLLTKAFGIGKRTSERVVMELKGKLGQIGSEEMVGAMDSDSDIIETLQNLGYTRLQAKDAVLKIDSQTKGIEDRIRAALKILKNVR
jgi:Holliday junction DNA helicase RuvA